VAATQPPTKQYFSGCDPARPDVCMLGGNTMPSTHRCFEAGVGPNGECWPKSEQECANQGMVFCKVPVTATSPPSVAATQPPTKELFSGCDPARPDVCMMNGNDAGVTERCFDTRRKMCVAAKEHECTWADLMVFCKVTGTPPSPVPATLAPRPSYCSVADWGSCSPTKCCASSNFECVKQDRWYSQCRPLGDCPKGWRCNKVRSMSRGEACGCSGYRGDGVTSSSPVLCKVHKGGADGRMCEAPRADGECAARTHVACGEKMRLRLLVNAAKSDILSGSLSKALTKAMRIEARQLVMEWICPDSVCQPECPATDQLKTLRECIKMVNDGQIRSRAAAGLSAKAEKFVITATFTEDATMDFEEEKMSELGRQIDLISGGMPHDDAADDLAPFIVRGGESVLEVSAEPTEDGPFGTEAGLLEGGSAGSSAGSAGGSGGSAEDGALPLPILIGSIAGALALCGGMGMLFVRRRAGMDNLRESTENDDIANMEAITYTTDSPSAGKARSGSIERTVVESGRI